MSSYIYTFIRRDIPHAQKIVQLGHATFEAGKLFKSANEISNLVLLSAENEAELLNISRKLDTKEIEYYMFYEPDNSMGYSAICTRPIFDPKERQFFKKWNLYRHTD